MKPYVKHLLLVVTGSLILACNQQSSQQEESATNSGSEAQPSMSQQKNINPQDLNRDYTLDAEQDPASRLLEVLESQPEAVKARYKARHPLATLMFFGIEPGMTVVEALPGGGWYSKILLDYLGAEGHLIGADYAIDMYPKFGFFDDKFLDAKQTWVTDWVKEAESWRSDNSATLSAFHFGSMPESMSSTADAIIFIRALHNLARFESDGGYLTAAMVDAFDVLKPGGVVGIVQHKSPDSNSDEWAGGKNGYLKESFVQKVMSDAGFEFVGSNDINLNPKDQPTESDIVWRLPPSLATSRDNTELKAQMMKIGESSRMTLLFRKPDKE